MNRFLIPLMGFVCSITIEDGHASFRTDIAERPPAEVLQKSLSLAQTEPCANATGIICLDLSEHGSGIALDRWTILTSASARKLLTATSILFVNTVDPIEGINQKKSYKISAKPIVHPGYKRMEQSAPLFLHSLIDGPTYFCGKPMTEVVEMDLAGYLALRQGNLPTYGPDLAILKLDTPLPEDLDYPKIPNSREPIVNAYCHTLGYGTMSFNTAKGPTYICTDKGPLQKRHFVGSHVSSTEGMGAHLLYGKYKGVMVHGDRSFTPNNDMMMMEGLPDNASSGGPLFQKGEDNLTSLVGIFQGKLTVMPEMIQEPKQLVTFANVMQPIFPIWTDVRKYKLWIDRNMGPKK